MRVYLAGKVSKTKWSLVEDISKDFCIFCSSDGWNHGEHEWGYSEYDFSNCNKKYKQDVMDYVIRNLNSCGFLVAYVETPDSFGTIAEIAWASSIGKESFLIINETLFPGEEGEDWTQQPMFDAYWFIGSFPLVQVIIVDSIGKAKSFIESLIVKRNYKAYLQTDHWKAISTKKKEEVNYKCQLCNGNGQIDVHHRIYEPFHEKLQDLFVICNKCHEKHHDILKQW